MIEKLSGFENNQNSRPKSEHKTEVDFKSIDQKLHSIQDLENQDRLHEICATLAEQSEGLFSESIIFEALAENQEFVENPSLLLDLSQSDIASIIRSYKDRQEALNNKTTAEEDLSTARQFASRVDYFQKQGLSNVDIVAQIIHEHEAGALIVTFCILRWC